MSAHAGVTFTTDRVARQVFCDMPVLKGEFHRVSQSYVASGSCVEIEAAQSNGGARNRSEFDQYNKSKDIWRAHWTAEGSYDPTTKVTTETVTLPAPNVDEFAPAGRPYGRFVSKMVCATDPWLETRASCTAITVSTTGNLGSMEKSLRLASRPFTSTEKEPMRNVLIGQHAKAAAQFSRPFTDTAQANRSTAATLGSGRSFSSRSATHDVVPTRSVPDSALAQRPAGAAQVATAPASAPMTYAPRTPSLDWSRAAPTALGSR
ncbi:MAG: hypothetical protein ABI143_11045 [Caldimonas sp.]